MYGAYYTNDTDKSSTFGSIGYIGLIKSKESGKMTYLCEAGSSSYHDIGDFYHSFGDEIKSIRHRGSYNLFDNENEVRLAFNRKYSKNFTLEKILRIQYEETIKILDN